MIESLLQLSAQIQSQKLPHYQRFLYDKIDFNQRLIGVMGARGAGKTTLLLQHLQNKPPNNTLYIIADHPLVGEHGLFKIADDFQKIGGNLLIIDEIHKSKNFEIELKLIYDSFFNLNVIFTGSSAAAINHAKADLSRRSMIYHLPVLSFREFLELETNQSFDVISLDSIMNDHTQYAADIVSKVKPLAYLPAYIDHGAYPFYIEAKETYLPRLLSASMQVLETDIPALYPLDYDKVNSLKKLMVMLCQSEPFDLNISKLCGAVGLNQKTVYKYLGLLQAAGLLRILGAKASGITIISKPEKLYLDNTNLFSVFCGESKAGTRRETFFASMLSYQHTLNYPKGGDFMVDERYVFEVGGRSKSKKQIRHLDEAWIVSDNLEIGIGRKIPLWLFGFLY